MCGGPEASGKTQQAVGFTEFGVMETCVLLPTSSCLNAVAAAETFIANQLPVFAAAAG